MGWHQLRLVGRGGFGGPPLGLPTFRALASTTVGPIVLTRSGGLMSVRQGRLQALARMEGAHWLLGAGSEVWIACRDGKVRNLSARDGDVLAEYSLPPGIGGLSQAQDGPPWALYGERSLCRVDLSEGRRIDPDIETPFLASGWILDRTSDRLQSIGSARSISLGGNLAGLESATGAPCGGVLVVTAGSLHLLDGGGQRRLTQGGFGYAVSAVPVAGSGRR